MIPPLPSRESLKRTGPPPRSSGPPPRTSPPPSAIERPIGIQNDLFGAVDGLKSEYTSKITAPIYEPKNRRPDVIELVDKTKAARLAARIFESNLNDDEKTFLFAAAARHYIFNYSLIADYYAHATPEIQRLMEESALVIVDFDNALRDGYVKYSEEISKIYIQEHGLTKD